MGLGCRSNGIQRKGSDPLHPCPRVVHTHTPTHQDMCTHGCSPNPASPTALVQLPAHRLQGAVRAALVAPGATHTRSGNADPVKQTSPASQKLLDEGSSGRRGHGEAKSTGKDGAPKAALPAPRAQSVPRSAATNASKPRKSIFRRGLSEMRQARAAGPRGFAQGRGTPPTASRRSRDKPCGPGPRRKSTETR